MAKNLYQQINQSISVFQGKIQTTIYKSISTYSILHDILMIIAIMKTNEPFKQVILRQRIIQKKSASGSRTLPFVIFDKKVPFFPKMMLFQRISG